MPRRTGRSLTDPEALMAELARIRERNYSTDNEEFMDDMTAVAVPIRDNQNRLVTTLSLHSPIQRRNLPDLVEYLPRLREAARQLEELI